MGDKIGCDAHWPPESCPWGFARRTGETGETGETEEEKGKEIGETGGKAGCEALAAA